MKTDAYQPKTGPLHSIKRWSTWVDHTWPQG